jgi:hypothetical protein
VAKGPFSNIKPLRTTTPPPVWSAAPVTDAIYHALSLPQNLAMLFSLHAIPFLYS